MAAIQPGNGPDAQRNWGEVSQPVDSSVLNLFGGSLGEFWNRPGRWRPVVLRGFSAEGFLELPEGTLCSTQLRVAGIETKTLEKETKTAVNKSSNIKDPGSKYSYCQWQKARHGENNF